MGFVNTNKNIEAEKQSQNNNLKAVVNQENCRGCQVCINYCPVDAIYPINNVVGIEQDKCIGCGKCVNICPAGAIDLINDNTNEK
jgi:hypothetical protein